MKREVHAFYDTPTATVTYVVCDADSGDAVIIDPLVDFDPATKLVTMKSLDRLIDFVRVKKLRVHWTLDTHAHADHLTGAYDLRLKKVADQWGMNERLSEVFDIFKKALGWRADLKIENLGVDRWFNDGEEFSAGTLRFEAIGTPGHTRACTTFRLEDWLFTGDAILMPDSGVGRCDFPGGSAAALYDSIWQRLYSFPDSFVTFTGHDYMPGGRPLRYSATIGEQKHSNIHLRSETSREGFIEFREGRDKTLTAPRLLQPSLDWNLGAHVLVPRPYFPCQS